MSFTAQRVSHTYTIRLSAPPSQAFPLFEPIGEKATIGQIDIYPDLPVHLRREGYAGECAVKENGTRGQDICLAQMKARGDDQDEKPLQAYVRSLYGGSWTFSVCLTASNRSGP